MVGSVPAPGLGAVSRALLAIACDIKDDRGLAEQICRACVEGLDIDGAAISTCAPFLRCRLYSATASTSTHPIWSLICPG